MLLTEGRDMVRAWLLMVAGRIVTDRVRPREDAVSPDHHPRERDLADQSIEMDEIKLCAA